MNHRQSPCICRGFLLSVCGARNQSFIKSYIPCLNHFVFPGKHMGLTAVEVEGLAGYSAFGEALERSHVGFIIAVCAVGVNDGLEFLPALADGNEGFSVKAYAVIFNGNFLRPVFVFLFADRFRYADIVIKTNSRTIAKAAAMQTAVTKNVFSFMALLRYLIFSLIKS